jgi:hypothetical protein
MSITLAAADTITGVAGSATSITYTIFGDEVSAGADAFKVLAQGQLPSSVGTLYTVPSSTATIVKQIHLVNGTGGSVTARLNVKGTAAANAILPAITILAGGFAIFGADGWNVYNDQGQKLSVGSTGATGDDGADGVGVPVGGTTGQRLAKIDATDFNTEWVTATSETEILNIPTAETDDSLVLAPDGAGGVEFRAETGGVGGGGLVLLEQHTASASASLDFTAFISGTYDEYLFELLDVLPATNAQQLYMRASVAGVFDSGSNYATGGWTYVSGGSTTYGSTTTQITTSNAADADNNAGRGYCGTVRLYSPASSLAMKKILYEVGWITGGVPKHATATATYNSTSAVDGFRFLFSSGNIASGTIRVYGIAK